MTPPRPTNPNGSNQDAGALLGLNPLPLGGRRGPATVALFRGARLLIVRRLAVLDASDAAAASSPACRRSPAAR